MAKVTLDKFKCPELFANAICELGKDSSATRVVGLDLGTNCGITVADVYKDKRIIMWLGQLDLSIGTYDSGVLRHLRLKQFLKIVAPDFICFEDVKYTPAKEQLAGKFNIQAIVARVAHPSEFLGGLKTTVITWAEENNVPYKGEAIGSIKKFATGKGNSGKEEMIKACNDKYGTDFDIDTYKDTGADNIADSAHVCAMGIKQFCSFDI